MSLASTCNGVISPFFARGISSTSPSRQKVQNLRDPLEIRELLFQNRLRIGPATLPGAGIAWAPAQGRQAQHHAQLFIQTPHQPPRIDRCVPTGQHRLLRPSRPLPRHVDAHTLTSLECSQQSVEFTRIILHNLFIVKT